MRGPGLSSLRDTVPLPGLDTAETEARLKDARLSFVSGHASLSTFAMWFCIVYLHQRMVSKTVLGFICV